MTDYDIINRLLLAVGVLLPIAFTFYIFLDRSRASAIWAKRAAITMCLAGLAWGSLDWVLLNSRSFHLTREVYDKLVGIRGLLGGVCIGIVFTIWVARPCKARSDVPNGKRKGNGAGG